MKVDVSNRPYALPKRLLYVNLVKDSRPSAGSIDIINFSLTD